MKIEKISVRYYEISRPIEKILNLLIVFLFYKRMQKWVITQRVPKSITIIFKYFV